MRPARLLVVDDDRTFRMSTATLLRQDGHVVAEAAEGTVRKLYAESKGRNAIHASDSDENAAREAGFFFAGSDVLAIHG